MTDVAFRAMGTDCRLIGTGVDGARAWLERYEDRLSLFRDSELARLNADPRPVVPASPMLRAAIAAALWAAERTGGLVDPTLTGGWRAVRVTATAVERRPGVALDTGGTGKGLAADHLARRIDGVADCGGDIRVVGAREVLVEHPLTGEPCARLRIRDGAVATSGFNRRGRHIVDPRTGGPVDTDVLQATALAPTALEAEALAKAALMGAPLPHGGVVVRA